jgi:hypothetical protein
MARGAVTDKSGHESVALLNFWQGVAESAEVAFDVGR